MIPVISKVSSPELMTILHNRGNTPIVRRDQSGQRLSVSGEVTQSMRSHSFHQKPKRVTGRNHPHRRRCIPDVVVEHWNWLEALMDSIRICRVQKTQIAEVICAGTMV